MQRRKGRAWEQDVARRFRDAMPGARIKRGWQARDGADAPDVHVPFFHLECKVGKQPNPVAALEQAEAACTDPTLWPMSVCKRDRQEPYVCMRLDDALELIAAWYREVKT